MAFSSIPTPATTPAPDVALKHGSAVAPMPISIENAAASDASAIAALGHKTFSETFGHTAPKEDIAEYLAATYSAEAILAEIPDATKTILLARDAKGHLVGMVQLVRGKTHPSVEGTPAEVAVLQRLYVDSSVHGQGTGTKLVAAVEEMALQEGFKQLWLTVWNEHEKAQRLYQKLGYIKTGEMGFATGATIQIDYVFAKRL